MNAAQEQALFWNLFAQLDSDQPGERDNALGKIHTLRGKMGWSRFVDLRAQCESAAATVRQLEAVEKKLKEAEQNRDQWEQAHGARVAENAVLARRNAALAARNATLRASLFVMLNWRMIAAACVVGAVGVGGWRVWTAQAAPDREPVGRAADDSANPALDAAFADVLSRSRWNAGDTLPLAVQLSGADWWIVIRGTVDQSSHADARGRPVERRCLQLYASEAVRDAGAFFAPSPYLAFGQWMKWPQRAAECRMPGKANYS